MTAPRLNRCGCGLCACPRPKNAAERSRCISKTRRLLAWIDASCLRPVPGSEPSQSPRPAGGRTNDPAAPAGRLLDESAAPALRVPDESGAPGPLLDESAAPGPLLDESAAPGPLLDESAAPGPLLDESAAPGPLLDESAAPGPLLDESAAPGPLLDESAAPAGRFLYESAAQALRVLDEFAAPALRVLDESAAPALRVLDARFGAGFVFTGRSREIDADTLTVRVVDTRRRVSMNARSIAKVVARHGRDDGNNFLRGRHHAAPEYEGKATATRPSTSHPRAAAPGPGLGRKEGYHEQQAPQ